MQRFAPVQRLAVGGDRIVRLGQRVLQLLLEDSMADERCDLRGEVLQPPALPVAERLAPPFARDHEDTERVDERAAGGEHGYGEQTLVRRTRAVVRFGVVPRIVAQALDRYRLPGPRDEAHHARRRAVARRFARIEAAEPKRLDRKSTSLN